MQNHSKITQLAKQDLMMCLASLNNAKEQRKFYIDGELDHVFPLLYWEDQIEHNQRQIEGWKEIIKKWELETVLT